jgi:hypothetical protein
MMDDFTLSLLTNDEVIAVNQKSNANRQLFKRNGLVAWIADVPGSPDKYLAVFNTRDKPSAHDAGAGEKVPIKLADLGLGGPCRIRDLWKNANIGEFNEEFAPEINWHGAGLYRVEKKAASANTLSAKPFLFGYALGDDSAKWMPEVASYTNFVWDWNSASNEDARPQFQRTIDTARKQGLKVVMSVFNKQDMDKFIEVGLDFVKANRDVVFAIGVDEPPSFGAKSEEIVTFCAKVKQALPGIQFWMILVENNSQRSYAIPDEADLLVLKYQGFARPQDIQRRAQESLPIWLKKFDGRPIVLAWDFGTNKSPGLVPTCQPETFTALSDIVRSNHFAGLLFISYGPATWSNQKFIGIESRPELVSEVKSIAKQWGIANP